MALPAALPHIFPGQASAHPLYFRFTFPLYSLGEQAYPRCIKASLRLALPPYPLPGSVRRVKFRIKGSLLALSLSLVGCGLFSSTPAPTAKSPAGSPQVIDPAAPPPLLPALALGGFSAQGVAPGCSVQGAGGSAPYASGGPSWRQWVYPNTTNPTPFNYATFSTTLVDSGQNLLEPYPDSSGTTYAANPLIYQEFKPKRLVLSGTLEGTSTTINEVYIDGRGSFGMTYPPNLGYYTFPVNNSFGVNYKKFDTATSFVKDSSGADRIFSGSPWFYPTLNGEQVRLPGNQPIKLEFALSSTVNYTRESIYTNYKDPVTSAIKQGWVVVNMPSQDGVLVVTAQRYVLGSSPTVYPTNGTPITLRMSMQGFNNTADSTASFYLRRELWYRPARGVASGQPFFDWLDTRRDRFSGWNTTDQHLGRATVSVSGAISNVTDLQGPADWNLGAASGTNPSNCLSKTVTVSPDQQTFGISGVAAQQPAPPVSVPDPARNLLLNGEAERDPAKSNEPLNWHKVSGGSVLITPGHANTPTAFGTTSATPTVYRQIIPAASLKPNTPYAFKGWLKGERFNCSVYAVYSAGGVDQPGVAPILVPPSTADWTEVGTTFTTPAAALDLQVEVQGAQNCAIDQLQLGPVTEVDNSTSDSDLIPADQITAAIDATITPPTAFAGSEVDFSGANSVGNALTYTWNFGDGTSQVSDPETSGDAVHTYSTPGYYTAHLTVVDAPTGAVKTADFRLAILPDINDLPSHRIVNVNETINFDVKYPVSNLTYEWSFDDGTLLKGSSVSKKVTQGGFSTYTLRVYNGTLDDDGQRHIVTGDEAKYNAALPPLDGDIATRKITTAGSTTLYDSNAFYADFSFPTDGTNVNIVSYQWDFGDGQQQTTTVPTVTHTYSSTSIYAAIVRVTDNYGRQATLRTAVDRSSLYPQSHIQVCLSELIGTCEWPQPPPIQSFPNPCTSRSAIICSLALQPLEVTQSAIANNLPYLLPIKGTQVLARIWPIGGSSLLPVETSFGSLKAGENVVSAGEQTARVYAFDGLRIPDYVIHILPDEQFDFMSPPLDPQIYQDSQGTDHLLQIVNIRESQITEDDQISFSLPIYAVDASGALLSNLSGKLSAYLKDSGVTAYGNTEIVNGVGQMKIYTRIANIQAGKVRPSAVEIISPNCYNEVATPGGILTPCKSAYGVNSTLSNYYCSMYYAGEYDLLYTFGCASNVTSSEAPKGLFATAAIGQLTAQRTVFNAQGFPLNPAFLNRISLGSTAELRKRIDDYLKRYDGSTVSVVVGLVPFLGDGSDLAIQAYYKYATDKGADPVVVTLAAVGFGVDTFTGAGGEFATGIKTVYKLGGPVSKEMISALVDSVKTKGARESFTIIKDSAGFMLKAAVSRNFTVLEDALALAKEGGGNSIQALGRFAASYKTIDAAFPKLPNRLLLKVAKYGMYAPETAKAMGKCGDECVKSIDATKNILNIKGLNNVGAISKFENSYLSVPNNLPNYVPSSSGKFVKTRMTFRSCKINVSKFLPLGVTDYKATFFAVYPDLKSQVIVHHAIEQQVLKLFPGLFTETEIHDIANLRGIPKFDNPDVHLSLLRKEWNKFYSELNGRIPSKAEVYLKVQEIDEKFGFRFLPVVC